MFFRRKAPEPRLIEFNEFGFGPYRVIFREHHIPGDQWDALRSSYDTELLPIEQAVGPAFVNRQQNQTVRRAGEVAAVIQGFGLLQLGDHGNPTGTLRQSPLTDINSAPGDIPINPNGPIGSFELHAD